jgi:glycerol-3-phosphate cytidylyltransferase
MKKVIITYGTFDILHYGHLRLLKRAKELGDYLAVGLSTDKFNELKGKKTILTYDERFEALRLLPFVDCVFPETCWEQKKDDIAHFRADIFTMGSDWEGQFDFLKSRCEVVYLPRTEGISTTEIKRRIQESI